MASAQELSDFLRSVEQRAFKQAVYAVRDDDACIGHIDTGGLLLGNLWQSSFF